MKEPGRQRLTRPRRERVREKYDHHLPAGITLDRRIYFFYATFRYVRQKVL